MARVLPNMETFEPPLYPFLLHCGSSADNIIRDGVWLWLAPQETVLTTDWKAQPEIVNTLMGILLRYTVSVGCLGEGFCVGAGVKGHDATPTRD